MNAAAEVVHRPAHIFRKRRDLFGGRGGPKDRVNAAVVVVETAGFGRYLVSFLPAGDVYMGLP